jgi:hypothetical protein
MSKLLTRIADGYSLNTYLASLIKLCFIESLSLMFSQNITK